MDLGYLFVLRDSRGFYLQQVVGEKTENVWHQKDKDFWLVKTLYAFGEYVQDGRGTMSEGHHGYYNKVNSSYWIWI